MTLMADEGGLKLKEKIPWWIAQLDKVLFPTKPMTAFWKEYAMLLPQCCWAAYGC
jgi:hypothetical protein